MSNVLMAKVRVRTEQENSILRPYIKYHLTWLNFSCKHVYASITIAFLAIRFELATFVYSLSLSLSLSLIFWKNQAFLLSFPFVFSSKVATNNNYCYNCNNIITCTHLAAICICYTRKIFIWVDFSNQTHRKMWQHFIWKKRERKKERKGEREEK